MALQFHLHHFRHFHYIGESGQGHGNIHAAHPNGQHAQGTAAGGMAVAAQEQSPRLAKPAALQSMADAVPGFGQDQTVFLSNGLQVNMVIRSFVVDLQQVVVNVADGQFGPYPVQVQGFKSQISHNRIDVVGQGLIHRHFDFLARHQISRFSQMRIDQFLRQILCHEEHSPYPL